MTADFQTSALWRTTLGDESTCKDLPQHAALRAAYLQFREVVKPLANDIAVSMPMFTDHSIEHIDSLWDTASILLPADYPINPAEAFVLGGAFLLHDLGMGLVAFPGGKESIERDQLYQDTLKINVARLTEDHRDATPDAIRTSAEAETLVTILRLRHAKQAERLVTQPFRASSGEEFRLIEAAGLRTAFGPLIGKLAHSHWFDVDDLPGHFPTRLGSYAEHPAEWEIDPLKLACILRLADAIHIDSRRAPTYLHAFRTPTGVSADHWYFQERLSRPRVDGNRLIFTSVQAFDADEARAWWLAFDTIQMIDSELRRVDALCADLGLPPFAARGVSGAQAPQRLAKFIPVTGWHPVDARLRVSGVERLVSGLGGRALYGDRPEVAIRELIANACDATRARVAQYGGGDTSVLVRLKEDAGEYWLTIEDRGIGMDQQSIVSSLTDFGTSKWTSSEAVAEYPGLASGGFKPTGRFGIGFFAIFMIADDVEVRSLKYRDAAENTSILSFSGGLKARPLIRAAAEDEQLVTGGTVVRAKLRNPPLSENGIFGTSALYQSIANMLRVGLREMCALLEQDLVVDGPEDTGPVGVVKGGEWKTLPPRELFKLIYETEFSSSVSSAMYSAYEDVFASNLQDLKNAKGEIVGRAILAAGLESVVSTDVWWWPSPKAKVYVGGLQADSIPDVLGVFCGEPLKADRLSAFPVATPDELKGWAESQAELVRKSKYASAETRYGAGDLARSVGAEVALLPCGYVSTGEISQADLASWLHRHDTIYLISTYELYMFHRSDGDPVFIDRTRGRELSLPANVIVLDMYARWFFPDEVAPRPKDVRFADYGELVRGVWNPVEWWYRRGRVGSPSLILEAAADAWDADIRRIVEGFLDLDIRQDVDQRLELPCADGSGHVLIEAFRLSKPEC